MRTFTPLKDLNSIVPILSKIAIFGAMNNTQLGMVFGKLERALFKPGEMIFDKEAEPDYIYIVKQGKINLSISDDQVTLNKKVLGVGDCFGIASLIAIHRHTTMAQAMEESEIMVLSRNALIELHQEDIHLFALLMMNIARELARRLELTDNILLHYLQNTEVKKAI